MGIAGWGGGGCVAQVASNFRQAHVPWSKQASTFRQNTVLYSTIEALEVSFSTHRLMHRQGVKRYSLQYSTMEASRLSLSIEFKSS